MWNFFLRNRKFTFLIFLAILLVGLTSTVLIPRESNPEVDIPVAVVTIALPGAGAAEIEELVLRPAEDRILAMEKIDTLTATAQPGAATLFVQFEADADGEAVTADLKDKMDEVKPDLPEDALDPQVSKISFDNEPVLTVAVSGPYDRTQLKGYGESLKAAIERVPSVSKVELIGGVERQVRVVVDRAQLDRYGLAIGQVTSAIGQANADIPVGTIETAGENYSIRFAGRLTDPNQIPDLPLAARGPAPVYVRDVATVVDGYREPTSLSRLSVGGSEPRPAVTLRIYKSPGGNIIEMIDRINEEMAALAATELPADLVLKSLEDRAQFIRDDLGQLTGSGLQTVLIVFLLLFIFLGRREALLAGLAIPTTFLLGIAILNAIGYTLNFLTLFSLILSLGILVDSAIVVVESMHVLIRQGRSSQEAAFETVRKYKLSLASGTLTTIFIFLPMVLTSGIMGQFIRSIPITVTVVLLSSLVIALGIVSTLGIGWLKQRPDEPADAETAVSRWCARWRWLCRHWEPQLKRLASQRRERIDAWRERYAEYLRGILPNRRWQRRFAAVLTLLFVVSLALPATGLLQVNMFPPSDQDTIYVSLELPVGSSLADTDAALAVTEAALAADPRVESFTTTVGSGSVSGSHLASLIVNLQPDNPDGSLLISQQYRTRLATAYAAAPRPVTVSITQMGMGPDDTPPVELRVVGDDLDQVEATAREYQTVLAAIPGTYDVKTDIEESNGELVVAIDRAKAQLYGLSAVQVAGVLRNAVYGSKATAIQVGDDDIEVTVMYRLDGVDESDPAAKTNRADISSVSTISVPTPRGDVPLSTFITPELAGARAAIRHQEGDRAITLTARTEAGVNARQVLQQFQADPAVQQPPAGVTLSYGGESEEIAQSFGDMFRAMILGIIMIAALLVWQFRSYRQPLFILATIPLALIGVLPGLTLIGMPLSFPGFIGVVALSGIVVNNAIILIDEINKARLVRGLPTEQAVVKAAKSRIQPILLTTITTVVGVLPLALSNPTWGPLGFSIVFGLVFSTVLTLVVVPLLYNRFAEKELEPEPVA
jgi:multidrug efflux pump subunit AcrB